MEYDAEFQMTDASVVAYISVKRNWVLKIFNKIQGSKLETDRELTDEEISIWTREEPRNPDDVHSSMRLLIIAQEHNPYRSVPMSLETLRTLVEAWSLPTETFRIATEQLPGILSFNYNHPNSTDRPKGLILRNHSADFWEFTLITIFDDKSKTTRAVCWGLSWEECDELRRLITPARETVNHFLFLPILLVDAGIHKLARFVEKRRKDASRVQRDLGMDDYFINRRQTGALQERINLLDLNSATEKLTSLSQSVVRLGCYCEAQMRFVFRLESVLKEMKGGSMSTSSNDAKVNQAFGERLSYLRDSITSIKSEVNSLQNAISGLVNTVYSLIAQSDSHHSLSSARSAARDSTDMRIIAVVTLVFLPATFTATLFSTSFFSFQVPDEPRVVSHWVWVYPAVAVGLTLVVFAAWAWWSSFELSRQEGGITKDKSSRTNLSRLGHLRRAACATP